MNGVAGAPPALQETARCDVDVVAIGASATGCADFTVPPTEIGRVVAGLIATPATSTSEDSVNG